MPKCSLNIEVDPSRSKSIQVYTKDSIRLPPSIQQIVLAGRHEPLAGVGELQRENAALVQVKLVFILWLCTIQHLHVAAFHADRQPIAGRTVAEREDLTREIVLRLLGAGGQVPVADGVIETASPQSFTVWSCGGEEGRERKRMNKTYRE